MTSQGEYPVKLDSHSATVSWSLFACVLSQPLRGLGTPSFQGTLWAIPLPGKTEHITTGYLTKPHDSPTGWVYSTRASVSVSKHTPAHLSLSFHRI